jgi:hypothetical protein
VRVLQGHIGPRWKNDPFPSCDETNSNHNNITQCLVDKLKWSFNTLKIKLASTADKWSATLKTSQEVAYLMQAKGQNVWIFALPNQAPFRALKMRAPIDLLRFEIICD